MLSKIIFTSKKGNKANYIVMWKKKFSLYYGAMYNYCKV